MQKFGYYAKFYYICSDKNQSETYILQTTYITPVALWGKVIYCLFFVYLQRKTHTLLI